MLPAKISSEMSEVRRDIKACDQGRLRGGILITLATVSYQVWSAAKRDPVDALRYE